MLFQSPGSIQWNSERLRLVAYGKEVIFYVGVDSFTVDGVEYELDVAARVINGTLMIPLRALHETFGHSVEWCYDTRTVFISTGE